MDTPERSKAGTPISKFEDSPVFSFLNSLSPIQSVKSVHTVQTFHSLSFASTSSVFTSPRVNIQKESRFSVRQSSSELLKGGIPTDNGDAYNVCTEEAKDVKPSGSTCTVTCSLNEAAIDPPDECSDVPSNLPRPASYDCSSPNHNTTPCYTLKSNLKLDMGHTTAEVAHYVHGLDKRKISLITEVEFQDKHSLEPSEEEVAGSDWGNLIFRDEDNLLIFDPSADSEACGGPDEILQDDDVKPFTSLPSHIQRDVIDESRKTHSIAFFLPCCKKIDESSLKNNKEVGKQHEADCTPQILSGNCQSQVMESERNHEVIHGSASGVSRACKKVETPFDHDDFQQQRGARRRCLNFEVPGFPKMSSQDDSNPNLSVSFPTTTSYSSGDQKLVPLKVGNPSPCILPSIGLHLNSLATTSKSKDRMLTREILVSERGLISIPSSISSCSREKPFGKSSSVEKDLELGESQDLKAMQTDASCAPAFANDKDLGQNSPKKKRHKSEVGTEGDSCKRCNCKKSKCLKLYCECFAAGVYCIEPCSCHGCLNKPIHEETVLSTRKQIESRDPLAFAPKVIRASESPHVAGEEANKTPASARHKRGCNCKKSSCLKKYCECYQGGVGCSISCRCEGCKNAFGRKDGSLAMEGEQVDCEEDEMDPLKNGGDKPEEGQETAAVQKDNQQILESISELTPFESLRPSTSILHIPTGKPPRSSASAIQDNSKLTSSRTLRKCEVPFSKYRFRENDNVVLEDDTPAILRGSMSPTSGVKIASPNQKRISPPHIGTPLSPNRKGSRKLMLTSIPLFPSLNGDVDNEYRTSCPSTSLDTPAVS